MPNNDTIPTVLCALPPITPCFICLSEKGRQDHCLLTSPQSVGQKPNMFSLWMKRDNNGDLQLKVKV